MDLPALIEKFLAWQRSRHCAELTINNQAQDLERFHAFIKANPQDPLTPAAIETYRKSRNIAPISWNREATSLRSLLRYAHGHGIIHDPVYHAVVMVKEPGKEPSVVQDIQEADYKASTADPRSRLIYRLMSFDGLRLCEVHRANAEDFHDGTTPALTVHGKGMRERTVYLHPETVKAPRPYLLARGLSPGPLFPSKTGRICPRMIQYLVKDISEDLAPQILRRTAVTATVNNLPDMAALPLVANQFGHTVPVLQKSYLHVDPAKVLAAKIGRAA